MKLLVGAEGDEPFGHALGVALLTGGVQLASLLRLGRRVLRVFHAVVHCGSGGEAIEILKK